MMNESKLTNQIMLLWEHMHKIHLQTSGTHSILFILRKNNYNGWNIKLK